ETSRIIVGADEDLAAGDDGVAEGVGTQTGDPADVPALVTQPVLRVEIEFTDLPRQWNPVGGTCVLDHVVARRGASPLRMTFMTALDVIGRRRRAMHGA